MSENRFLGSLYGLGAGYAGAVWDKEAIAPTLTTMQGGGREPMIIEKICIGGMQEHQAIKTDGIVPTLTSSMGTGGGYVPMVIESKIVNCVKYGNAANSNQRCAVYDEKGLSPTIQAAAGTGGNQQPMWVEVKQATKEGFIPCEIGGVADLSYPESQTRRGRVIEKGNVSPTLTTENIPSVLEKWIWEIDGETYLIRIRKLTPKECWRLMDFTDEDFHKAEEVNSNTQLYKQAGNSIVKNVLCEVFRNLF